MIPLTEVPIGIPIPILFGLLCIITLVGVTLLFRLIFHLIDDYHIERIKRTKKNDNDYKYIRALKLGQLEILIRRKSLSPEHRKRIQNRIDQLRAIH